MKKITIAHTEVAQLVAAGLWENGEKMRKWRGNGERMRKWREIDFLHFLILYPFLPSFPISYIKIRHILLQNVKYGTFVANVTKISTYALWGNNTWSNLLRGFSASCAGLNRQRRNQLFFVQFLEHLHLHLISCDSDLDCCWARKNILVHCRLTHLYVCFYRSSWPTIKQNVRRKLTQNP